MTSTYYDNDRRDVHGDTIFEGLHIVSLPWPDNIGSAGTSSHIAEYFGKHGVQVKYGSSYFFVLSWVYYVFGFLLWEKNQKTRNELSVERHLEVYNHYCSIIRLGGAAQHLQGKRREILCAWACFGEFILLLVLFCQTAWRKMDEEMKLCASEAKARASAAIAQAALARELADQARASAAIARESADQTQESADEADESAQHAVSAATRADELLQAWLRGAYTGASSGSSGISSTA